MTETRYKVSRMIQVQRRMDIKQIQLPAREPTSGQLCFTVSNIIDLRL